MRNRSFAVRHRAAIIVVTIILAGVFGVLGADVQSVLKSGGFEDPDAESSQALEVLGREFGAGQYDAVLIVTAESGGADDPAVVAAAAELEAELAALDEVKEVASYWSLGSPPPLRSTSGERGLMLLRFNGDEDERLTAGGLMREEFIRDGDVIDTAVGGFAPTFNEVNEVVEDDLVKGELIAIPLTMILLVYIFGSVVAALLPLMIAGFAIISTFAALMLMGSNFDVSIFALNFTTAMGLGLAVDYSLLIVSRFREELDRDQRVHEAVRRTVMTAGRTVLFSAFTVAASLVALLVFKQYFLRSFAYAGITVVLLSAIGATLILPAILAMLGHNVNRWQVRKPKPVTEEEGVWHRIAMTVMRRPVPIATGAILFLVFLGLPFLRVELGFPDDRVLPPGFETRDAGDILREDFNSNEAFPTSVVAADMGDPAGRVDQVDEYAKELSRIDGVARVDTWTGSYLLGAQVLPQVDFHQRFGSAEGVYFNVVPGVEPFSLDGEQMVDDIRAADAPFDVRVGGSSAELVDGKAGLMDRLPLALLTIGLVTFIVLFMSFGSILMPIKAIVLNLLSLTATFGAMVWIFQDGHFADALGFTATGTLVITMPVLMFITAFGLSMDYEVFLLSRIKEEYDRTGDDVQSVALGLERTGRIVTAAAVLIAVVFLAFSTGNVSFMKMWGLGLTLAVLVDAFVVRTTLVPAFMRLAGKANWWAPKPLRRIHELYGFSEHVSLDGDEAPERELEPAS